MFSILLVDDEQFTRQGLRSLIDWKSCDLEVIEEADNGEDALQLIEEKKPDIVITDIRMPVLDGLELIRTVSEMKLAKPPAFIIISGYNDFKYAQQAVRYGVHDFILKPIDRDEMTNTLRTLQEKLASERQQKLRSERLILSSVIETLIKGEASPDLIEEWRRKAHDASSFTYLFIELNDVHPWTKEPVNVTMQDFKEGVQAELHRLMPDFEQIFLHEHRGRLGVIITDHLLADYGGSLETFARVLKKRLTDQYGERIFLFAGSAVECLSKLPHSYETAREALLYKYIFDDERIVLHEQVRDMPLNYIEVNHELDNRLLQQLEEAKESELAATIDQLFEQFRSRKLVPEAVKMNLHHSVTAVVRMIQELGGDERELSSLVPIISWHDLNLTIGEIRRLFDEFIGESGHLIRRLMQESNKGNIAKIKHYIETNFHKNISLKSLASEFYLNPVYLGQLFKKHYGKYFNEYVLELRIMEAKKLLRQTDLRVYEIAERVGFKNADYFVTQFEKLEHMTPTEYRTSQLGSVS